MSPAKRTVQKKATAKKATAKNAVTKKSVVKKSVVKTSVAKKSAESPAAGSAAARASAPVAASAPLSADALREAAKSVRRGRAAQRRAFVTEQRGTVDHRALADALRALHVQRTSAPLATPAGKTTRLAAPLSLQATDNVNRWVPIGPSVVRRGQADGRPRVSGCVKDIAVDEAGRRAYAATGKGGVWYTEDAGASWRPVGGWVGNPARRGGLSSDLACSCLLVHFGAVAADDYVMVGTGEGDSETVSTSRSPTSNSFGGRGVLAGKGPVLAVDTDAPFESGGGIELLENTGIDRLARDPSKLSDGDVGAAGDRVLAAAFAGLFLGTRATVNGALVWQWIRVEGLEALRSTVVSLPGQPVVRIQAPITDVAWVPVAGVPNGRIIVAISREGVAFSDALGVAGSWHWIGGLNRALDHVNVSGRHSFSRVGDRLYVLVGIRLPARIGRRDDTVTVRRVPNITRAAADGGPGASELVRGCPADLWGAQRFWNQAIVAERVDTTDRVWLGGLGLTPFVGADFSAAVFCFDVQDTGAGSPRLVPGTGISRVNTPALNGDGANIAGLVGNGIHSDVHAIVVVTRSDGTRSVWVGCDGGIFVSDVGGRVNTFQSRTNGMAAIEAGSVAMHPTSSHFCALGAQDNGVQARSGDTMWELIQDGDGGGVMFHPTASQFIVSQFTNGSWNAAPPAGFVGPLDRARGGQNNTGDRESDAAAFYSGCDAIANPPTGGRIAMGTTRVWFSDNLGTANPCTWRVIPFNTNAATAPSDPRPDGTDVLRTRTIGVSAAPALGVVIQLRWATPTRLYAIYRSGIVRHDEAVDGKWSTTVILAAAAAGAPNDATRPDLRTVVCTDLTPVPGTADFYLTTLGDREVLPDIACDTCWHFSGGTFHRTRLRRKLDPPGPLAVLGPLDPAHAVCLDPADSTTIYVGTFAGAWRGKRANDGTHTWDTFMNGMPVTCVTDLKIWTDPANGAGAPKLLRASTQSRGVWEVNLADPEPSRTYLRIHQRDDRRMLPSPLQSPRLAPTALPLAVYASPDVVIRPAPRDATAALIPFPLAADEVLGPVHNDSHHLWTFQTAFRWHFPAIRPDGQWTDQLARLIELFRNGAGLGNDFTINKATWNAVVGGTRLSGARTVTTASTDRFAVYETPWQTPVPEAAVATEVDVLELVQPLRVQRSIWQMYSEPWVVDVLLHHRDTRRLVPNDAYVALFWRVGVSDAALLAEPAATFNALHAWAGGATVPLPANWTSSGVMKLSTTLDAFMPRAISIPVAPGIVPTGNHVLFLAVCGSSAEAPPPAPVGLTGTSTIGDLVRAWPRAALRLVQVVGARPV